MIIDDFNTFSRVQAITGNAASADTIDLGPLYTGNTIRNIGVGEPHYLVLRVGQAFNTLTSLTVDVQTDDNTSFSSATTVASVTYLLAQLTAGALLDFPDYVPQGVDERYFRLQYDVTGTNPTAGTVTAGIVAAKQTNTGAHYGG